MSTSAFEPVTIAHVFQPGREADPHAPEQELQLVRTGKFVFTYAHPAGNENNATSMLHEVLAFVGQGKRRVRHMYSNQSHVTVEVTDTEIIARDFDGNDDRQHFTGEYESIIYNGRGAVGPFTSGPFGNDDLTINTWA